MVKLQIVWRHNATAALEYAERGRARTLLEAMANVERIDPITVGSLREHLPHHVAALFFVTLSDRLLVWVVRDTGIDFAAQPIAAAQLGAETDRIRWLMRQAASNQELLRSQLTELFKQLIGPVTPFIAGEIQSPFFRTVPSMRFPLPRSSIHRADGTLFRTTFSQ